MELGRRNGRGNVIRKTRFGGQTIRFISVPDDDMPFAPAWTITDEYLVVGLMPQAVKAFLARADRDESIDSLDDVTAVADALSAGDGPACIAYLDTERIVRGLYPLLQIGARLVCVELRKEGIDVDVSLLPSADSIARHMGPAVSTWSRTDGGFLAESKQPFPGGGNLVGAAPVAIAVLLPAVQSARSASRETHETNNLKQLGLAFHNYVSANRAFPKNFYDEGGKPLLSWRVQLLPYLEESALYEEFHLDEPWNSEHNKRLIERMPALLSSPSGPAPPGMTRFVALAGEGTIFPGNEKISFRHVLDGSSKTLMFVRAAPQTVVTWTRPDDIAFDPKKPRQGLDSPQGYFLAAFTDGSVRRLSLRISDKTLRNLALRADGEIIHYEDLDVPPGR